MDIWQEHQMEKIKKLLNEIEINVAEATSVLYWLKGRLAMLEQNIDARFKKLEERQDPGKYNEIGDHQTREVKNG